MSEVTEVGPVVKVARDLTEIEKLAVALEAQTLAKANDRLMPGGLAMVSLAPDADLDEWAERIAAAELRHFQGPNACPKDDHRDCVILGAEHVEDEDDQHAEDPLRTLLFWTDAWREEHGSPLDGRRPTLATEANFLRWMLPWAWDNEPHWNDLADDVNRARRKLENMLYAGQRSERTRVPCDAEDCERKPRLIKVYGDGEHNDRHKCPACKRKYDADDFARAHAKHLRSEGAQKFVPLRDAVATLRSQGRAERTIRKWLADKDDPVEVALDELGRRFVWWPDLWRRHLTTATRERKRESA